MAHLARSWRFTRGIIVAAIGAGALIVTLALWLALGWGMLVLVCGATAVTVFLVGVAWAAVSWLGHIGAVEAFVPPPDPPPAPEPPAPEEPFRWDPADPESTEIVIRQWPGLDLAGDRIRLIAVEGRAEQGRGAVMARRNEVKGTWVPADYVIRLGGQYWRVTPSPAHVLDQVTLTRIEGDGAPRGADLNR